MDAAKGLFQDSGAVKEQYREVRWAALPVDFYENTLLALQTTGSDASNCTINGADSNRHRSPYERFVQDLQAG